MTFLPCSRLRQRLGLCGAPAILRITLLSGVFITISTMISLHGSADRQIHSVPTASRVAAEQVKVHSSDAEEANEAKSSLGHHAQVGPTRTSASDVHNRVNNSFTHVEKHLLQVIPAHASSESVSHLIRTLIHGIVLYGGCDMVLQALEIIQDRTPSDQVALNAGFPSAHDLDWRRLSYAACWGGFLQATLLPHWFGFLESWPSLEPDLKLFVHVVVSLTLLTPVVLGGSYLYDIEQGWLQGRSAMLELAIKYKARLEKIPAHYLGWALLWPCYLVVCFWLVPMNGRAIATGLSASAWHASMVYALRRQINIMFEEEVTYRTEGGAARIATMPSWPNADSVMPSLSSAVKEPDFESTHRAAISAMFDPVAESMLQENKVVVLPAVATTVLPFPPEVGGDDAASGSLLESIPEPPPRLDASEVQEACREAMLKTIRKSAPPIIQQFLEANVDLLGMSAPTLPGSSLAATPVLDTPFGHSFPDKRGGVQDEEQEDDESQVFAPGSYGAIAAILAKAKLPANFEYV
eukprot:CAMPEP_0203842340 /NCGR_PEP_ID=MMETSP0359-20131031/1932_1 /ASSEMBLY_ACC=CAM_ASM_000338 /TAXON_ID=268821 /ORGANISM="Scrippsiella Hangoei, Strain SHTV-5" /LENGTH=522 /DNA_ID=CAMNT_0050756909 /DNA_START=53 /DNA_END=1618 /DNA_ORIENTATION=-